MRKDLYTAGACACRRCWPRRSRLAPRRQQTIADGRVSDRRAGGARPGHAWTPRRRSSRRRREAHPRETKHVLAHQQARRRGLHDGDPEGRPTVADIVARLPRAPLPRGRLGADTSGLLLLTNDGELANRLPHPSYHQQDHRGAPARVRPGVKRRLIAGIELEGLEDPSRSTASAWSDTYGGIRPSESSSTRRNRLVRRMMDAVPASRCTNSCARASAYPPRPSAAGDQPPREGQRADAVRSSRTVRPPPRGRAPWHCRPE